MKQTVVVMADDALHAVQVAFENQIEIVRDSDFQPGVAVEVTGLTDLCDPWDGDCIPYGGDGDTMLKELLPCLGKLGSVK